MKKILLINTGGTFNKVYNPNNGALEIDVTSHALDAIASKWLCNFEVIHIIGKDSLDMNDEDRATLLETLQQTPYTSIIVIHGTDTMDRSATYIADAKLEKSIVFTGAMVPYSIDSVEATANLASAYGYLQALKEAGVYVVMNAVLASYAQVKKDRKKGKFTLL